MIDAALIENCADPALKPAIVERFIAEAGSPDPLAVTVRSGDRVVLVPRLSTSDDAMALVRQYVGQAVVRVGITQYPAGLGIADPSELKPGLVDACENIRMGTALFGKVYRIVTKWYGNAVDEAFDDAIYAWRTGYFEGRSVFSEPDASDVPVATPELDEQVSDRETGSVSVSVADEVKTIPEEAADPNTAGIRIDLSAIGGAGR